ncbi:MAG: glycosyltransferase family 1 protein [Eubacteriales bacterium]|nr:glycosyltransferase family 1 protein [Eubacteriales bacterium]MDD3880734.1 glycosyltransferase family 1 protein [Eubacteriales bacterium]MDD4511632.1 glycosyltransferase family 1 protein [Eubacteriales bacterium]
MIRILHSVSNMDRAGIETMLMNYYRNIDRTKIQFDFLANKPKIGDYEEEIKALGGHIYRSPGFMPQNIGKYMDYMRRILSEDRDIRILHVHNESFGAFALVAARKCGMPNRLFHAHSTNIKRDFKYLYKLFCKRLIPKNSTMRLACSKEAARFFFGSRVADFGDYLTIHNAIDLGKFAFSEETRAEMRSQLGLSDKFVIGHIGRFSSEKNQTRLVEMLPEIQKLRRNAVLLLVGEGELAQDVKKRVSELSLSESVVFTGSVPDTHRYYQAMDVFVLPSLFEGLPVTGIEAQANGLPCLFSSGVPDEAASAENTAFLPLSETNERWAQEIMLLYGKNNIRSAGGCIMKNAGYDIGTEALKLQELYLSIAKAER